MKCLFSGSSSSTFSKRVSSLVSLPSVNIHISRCYNLSHISLLICSFYFIIIVVIIIRLQHVGRRNFILSPLCIIIVIIRMCWRHSVLTSGVLFLGHVIVYRDGCNDVIIRRLESEWKRRTIKIIRSIVPIITTSITDADHTRHCNSVDFIMNNDHRPIMENIIIISIYSCVIFIQSDVLFI